MGICLLPGDGPATYPWIASWSDNVRVEQRDRCDKVTTKTDITGSRTLVGLFPEENSNEKNFNQGLNIQVNGVSVENYNLKSIDNEQDDLVVEDLSKILRTLENKGYIII